MSEFNHYTIEPMDDEFWLVGHGVYERGSVLAGQARRALVSPHATVEEAQAACPMVADVLDHSTRAYRDPGGSLGDMSGLPSCPPSGFDPGYAGESWDEDY
jgi:hypothetical protein